MRKIFTSFLTCLFLFSLLGFAQVATPNDECSSAINLVSGVENRNYQYRNYEATVSLPGCETTNTKDIWFKFTATASRHQILKSASSGDHVATQVFEGNCGNLKSIVCDNTDFAVDVKNLTPGKTYYYRLYLRDGKSTNTYFYTYVTAPPLPENDEPSGAISLTVNQTLATSLGYATYSLPQCHNKLFYTTKDVFYKFVATKSVHLVSLSEYPNLLMSVYSGTPDTLTIIRCGSQNERLTNLSIGETYYIRVHDNYPEAFGQKFKLKVSEEIPQITSFSPTNAIAGSSITILGSGFSDVVSVSFGSDPAVSFEVNSGNNITAVAGSGATGDVTVTNLNGSGSLAGFVLVKKPEIASFFPAYGFKGDTVTIKGANFIVKPLVYFGGVLASSVSVKSDSILTAIVGTGGSGNVAVENIAGKATAGSFKYISPPIISVISPSLVKEGTEITITGVGFTSAVSVSFGGTSAKSFDIISDNEIKAIVGKGSSGSVVVVNKAGQASKAGLTYIASPVIRYFFPNSASALQTVKIVGSGFVGVTDVKFGEVKPLSFTISSDTLITAVVSPSGASGIVWVNNIAGFDSINGFKFKYVQPKVESFTPQNGFPGSAINVSGSSFLGVSDVKFGGVSAKSFVVNSATSITAILGTGASGVVTVENPDYKSVSVNKYTVIGAPSITSFNPIIAKSTKKVTIIGSNFYGVTKVLFGGVEAVYTVVSPTVITAYPPLGTVSGNISVTNGLGTTALDGFTYVPPVTISSFNPLKAAKGDTVIITGTNFVGIASVKFGNILASSFIVNSPTEIRAVLGSGTSGDILVTLDDSEKATIKGFVFLPAPTISSFSPLKAGSGSKVTIAGSNLNLVTSVTFGGVPASAVTVNSAGSITATVNSGASGDVAIVTPGGMAKRAGFTFIDVPKISSFSPSSAGKGTSITITGENFINVSSVRFGGVPATSFKVLSSTAIAAVVGATQSGSIDVVTSGGSVSINNFSFINAPAIGMISPTTAGPGESVVITGLNLSDASAVSFGNIPVDSFVIVSPKIIRAYIGKGASGLVKVTTLGGIASKSGFVLISPPIVTSFKPAYAAANAKVTITGGNFIRVSRVTFGGVPAALYTVNSAGSIVAYVPSDGISGAVSVTGAGGTGQKDGFGFVSGTIATSSGTLLLLDNGKTVTLSNDILVYPNPFGSNLFVSIPDEEDDRPIEIRIFTLDGTTALKGIYLVKQGMLEINTEKLFAGTYLLSFKDSIYKVIKK